MTIKIETGKFYVDGRGHKRGPMVKNTKPHVAPHEWECSSTGAFYHSNGMWTGYANSCDLIAEWTEPTFKDVGTLAEIGAKVGDVVASDGHMPMTIASIDRGGFEVDEFIGHFGVNEKYRIIRRAEQPAPAPTGPVRRTQRIVDEVEILPGVYGDVVVWNDGSGNVSMMPCNTADRLTAAIATLTEIRDAMQEAGE